jgi:DNA polymerase III subunit epsilon
MEIPSNLISDSGLVQEAFDLVSARGGPVSCTEIADVVFRLSHAPADLATNLVNDLIRNDPRFKLDNGHLSIGAEETESRPLNELEFVVVDVEAIASRSVPARIIEIGALRVRGGHIVDEFQTLTNPEAPLPPFIASLTGISNNMLERAPRFSEIVHDWLNFAGHGVLVAHNATFDLPLLNQEIARVFPGHRMRNPEICTVQLSRRMQPNLDGHSLDALADHFGFEITDRHRASGDALATAKILLRLLDELEIHGVTNLAAARTFRLEKASAKAPVELALDV